jgi:hypothetical protein
MVFLNMWLKLNIWKGHTIIFTPNYPCLKLSENLNKECQSALESFLRSTKFHIKIFTLKSFKNILKSEK